MTINVTTDILFSYTYDFNSYPGQIFCAAIFDFADMGIRNQVSTVSYGGFISTPANHTGTPWGTFTGPSDMASYFFSAGSSSLIAAINTFQSDVIYAAGSLLWVDESVQMLVNTKQNWAANLDKLSATTLVGGNLFRTSSDALSITQISMTDFMSGLMASTSSSVLASSMGLATVATSGAYSDLSGKPSIPSAQVQTDWNATTGTGVLLNKPSLSAVATSGSYTDLSSKPTIPSPQVNSDWSAGSGIAQILNKPSLATVATTGSYSDLSGKPTIPAAQVNSDWNSSSGVSQILNKPSIPSITRTTSTLSLSLVGGGATGTQISASKDSTVRLNVSTSTTSTIGGPSTSLVTLKICSTNNATEGNWTSVATVENDQTITLAIVLNSIQVLKGQLCADVPAGWYVKLVNSGTGTHSEAFVSGQQTIYG